MTTSSGESSGDSPLLARARAARIAVGRAYSEQLAVVAELEAGEVALARGYKSTPRMLEDLWRVDPAEAKRLVRHAALLTARTSMSGEALPALLPDTAGAVRDGLLSSEHVQMIDAAMAKIADVPGLPVEDIAAAESLLAESAAMLAPAGLRRVADRLVDTMDPDGAAPPDPEEPIDEMVMSRRRGDKAVRFAGMLHGVEGECFWEVVDSMSTPAGPDDERSLSQRRAAAICELAAQALSPTGIAARNPCCDDHDPHDRDADDRGPAGDADDTDARAEAEEPCETDGETTDSTAGDFLDDAEEPAGGTDPGHSIGAPADALPDGPTRPDQCATIPVRGRALLTVTMDYRDLTERVGHGLLDSGLAVSPETVRRLACDAGIVPVILGSRSEPLDIGRLAYGTPDGMRRALHHRDRGCTFPGCTRRPRRCHAHHVQHWLDLGATALENMCLLCRCHHDLVHHSGWTVAMKNGRPWFTPPAWIDPVRTPRPGGVDTILAG